MLTGRIPIKKRISPVDAEEEEARPTELYKDPLGY
jgi:hypothetical protein